MLASIMTLLFSLLVCLILPLDAFYGNPLFQWDVAVDRGDFKNVRFLPPSALKPNVAVSINKGFGVSVNNKTGKVNLAGGIGFGTSVDAGFTSLSQGNAVTFTEGGGRASATGFSNSGQNQGARAQSGVKAELPSVSMGFAFGNQFALSKAFGKKSAANSQGITNIGREDPDEQFDFKFPKYAF